MSSVGVKGVIGHPRDLFRCADNWRLVAAIAANPVDAITKRRIGDVFEVPSHHVFYPVSGSDSNVSASRGSDAGIAFRSMSASAKSLAAAVIFSRGIPRQFVDPFLCSVGIASETFVNDKLPDEEFDWVRHVAAGWQFMHWLTYQPSASIREQAQRRYTALSSSQSGK
jgi:hypothetical protein